MNQQRRQELQIAKEVYLCEMDRIAAVRAELFQQECMAVRELEMVMLADDPALLAERAKWYRGET